MKIRKVAALFVAAILSAPVVVSALTSPTALVPVSPGLARDLSVKADGSPEEFFVRFHAGDAAQWRSMLTTRGLHVVDTFERINTVFVTGTVGQVKGLRHSEELLYLEDNARLEVRDETSGWAVRSTAGSQPVFGGPYRDATGKVLDGSGVGVAIVDSGVDSPHPDLAKRIVKNYKVECSFVLEYSATGRCAPGPIELDPGTPSDTTSGHGTHVAGIIAGDGTASNGTYKGQAPGAGLYTFGTGEAVSVLFAVESYEYILDNQRTFNPAIRVINNSYGDPGGTAYNPSNALSALVKQAADAGIISVFAAGNDGAASDTGAKDEMSSYAKDPTPGVISVANYNDNALGTRDFTLSTSSSRGKKGVPTNYPDVSAPGSTINSTCNPRLTLCAANPSEAFAPYYSYMSGTSMATPHTVGIIALLLQAHPELAPAQVERLLQSTAYKFNGGTSAPGLYEADPQNPGGTTSYDKGAGLIDVPAALNSAATAHDGAASAPAVKITSPTSNTEQTGSITVRGTATDGNPLIPVAAGTLATDPAGDFNGGGKAADLVALGVTEKADGIEYSWKVVNATDTGAATNVSLRVTQKINGVAYLTNVLVTPTTVSPSAFNATSNNAAATVASRDVASNTITAFVPWANLGNPAAGTPAYTVFASSFIGAINDVLPGGGGGDAIARPQFLSYSVSRTTAPAAPVASVSVTVDNGAAVPAALTGTSPSYGWTASVDLSSLAPGGHTVTAALTLDGVARASNQILVVIPAPTVYSAAIVSPAAGSNVFRAPGVVAGTTSVNKPVTGVKSVTVQVTAPGYDSNEIVAAGVDSWTADVDYSGIVGGTATIVARFKLDGATVASDTSVVNVVNGAQVIRTVVCGTADDAAAIQAAIDASSPGDTVALSGVCDVSNVAPHGGNIWSITDAAVVVDRAITLRSAGAPRSATIKGNGRQAAVLIAPSGDGATVKGLTFDQLGRAIVVWNANGVTIGSSGAINNSAANRIKGGPTMNQAILALSNTIGADNVSDRAIVNVAGRHAAVTMSLVGQRLTSLQILGNYVSYTATGPPDPNGAYDVVAIDVRQRTAGAEGILIANNAVGMGGSEFPSVNMNGVRVYSHALEPIDNVVVQGNNLGRNEDLAGTPADAAADVQTAGRVGILIHRVTNFGVDGNGVRVRLSPTGVPMPGGGIVIADSSNGRVNGNGVIELADPSTADADLGAIGVIDQFSTLFNGRTDVLPTADISIENNIVGMTTGDSTGVGAQKGIVLNGVTRPLVNNNIIKFTTLDALNIGTAVSGPGDVASPGIKTVTGTVREGIACHNYLDTSGGDLFATDNTSEVTAGSVTGSAFPGGYSATNSSCYPTLKLTPSSGSVKPGQDLVASVAAMPNHELFVNLFDEDFGRPGSTPNILKTVNVGPTGRIDVTFTAAELQGQVDGSLTITAFLYYDNINYQDSKTTTLAAHPLPLPGGTVTLNDGGDGFTNAVEAHANIPVTWVKPNDTRAKTVKVWFADASGFIPVGCGPSSTTVTGAGYLNATCADNLPEGVYTFNAQWGGDDGLLSGRISVSSIKDTVATAPVVTTPAAGFDSGVSTVTIAGSADPGNRIVAKAGSLQQSAVAGSDGAWSAQLTLPDGAFQAVAVATDAAGNSATSAPVAFRVITTSTAPDAPVITSPATGSDVLGTFTVRGTGPAGTTVIASADGTEWKRGPVSSTGTWSLTGTLADGPHTLSAVVSDSLGRLSPATSITLTVDGTKPVATIDPTAPVYLPGQATLTGSATDNMRVSRVTVQMVNTVSGNNAGPLVTATCTGCGTPSATWSAAVPTLRGTYTANVIAYDAAGNASIVQKMTFVVTG